MRKPSKSKSLLVTPQDEPGVIELINKMQQQLSAMEKKLDSLIDQSLKPSRSFSRPPRYDKARGGDSSRERTFTKVVCADCNKECEIPFKPSDERPVYCRECFPKHKKGSSLERQTGKRRKPAKKKPFYARIKKRG